MRNTRHKYITIIKFDKYCNKPTVKLRKEVWGMLEIRRNEVDNWSGPWKIKIITATIYKIEGRARIWRHKHEDFF